MQKASLLKVCQQVYARFPQLQGVQPQVKNQVNPLEGSPPRYLLIFQIQSQTANGKAIVFRVRVVADERGQIIKMTTSR